MKSNFGRVNVAALALALATHSAYAAPISQQGNVAQTQAIRTGGVTASGFSEQRLATLDAFLTKRVAEGDMAGAVVLIARHGKIVHLRSVGLSDIDQAQPMKSDTIFRAYSMTKPVAAIALMMLYERGLFQLDDPIAKYIPEFAGIRVLKTPTSPLTETVAADRPPTIHDLMRHTSGLGHGWGDDAVDTEYRKQNVFGLETSMKAMSEKLARIPLLYQPGTRFNYAVGADVEARLIEILSGKPYDVFLRDELFAPLGMIDSGFSVDPAKVDRLATVYWQKDGKLSPLDEAHGYPTGVGFLAEPWTVNSYTQNHARKGGSYGLVTTATDYWHFAQMLLNHGILDGHRLLSPSTIDLISSNHMDAKVKATFMPGLGYGLGFAVVEDPAAAGGVGTAGTYYWSGAANTHFWIDPKNDLIVVAMTQDMSNPNAQQFRDQVKSLVYGALMK